MLRFTSPAAAKFTYVISALGFCAMSTSSIAQGIAHEPYTAYGAYGSQPSSAQLPFSIAPVKTAKWVAIFSAHVDYGSSFWGAQKSAFSAYPLVRIRRGGEARHPAIPGDSFDIDLLNNAYISAGPTGRYRAGRYVADDRKLLGLRKLPWTIEGGAFVEIWPMHNMRARVEARHGFRDVDGWVADIAADFVRPFGQFMLTVGPRATWGNDKTARNTFGVTSQEAALNNLAFPQHGLYAYTPKSGIQSAGAAASLAYKLNDEWSTTATASYNRLVGDAGKSPIVKKLGNRNQFKLGLEATYALGID